MTRTQKHGDAGAVALHFEPLGADNWTALEQLFGARGACGGCWCMWHRLPRRIYDENKGAGNRMRLRALVDDGADVGVLGFHGNEPIAWCSIAPRSQYARRMLLPAERSGRSEESDTWAILCLFVSTAWRRRGVSVRLIEAGVAHAAARGARRVLASAIVPQRANVPPLFAFQGLVSAYRQAGFEAVERTSAARMTVMRTIR